MEIKDLSASRFCITTPRKAITIQAKSADKKMWVKAIQEALAEYNKHQELKVAAKKNAGGEERKEFMAPVWNANTKECEICKKAFNLFSRRPHHCRRCGRCLCSACSPFRWFFPGMSEKLERVCQDCHGMLVLEAADNPNPDTSPKAPTPPARGQRVRS